MSHQLPLSGLDGANPLGFLAALGTLRTVSRVASEYQPKLLWRVEDGAWRPVLQTVDELTQDLLLTKLDDALKQMGGHAAWALGDNLNVSPASFRSYAASAARDAQPGNSAHADFAAAFASEAVIEVMPGKDAVVSDTALRTMSGAGHQHFIGFMQQLVVLTNVKHVANTLFAPWRYDDDKPSLRWDPEDDRRYALRWHEPSGDPIKTMRGANRLAIEALPLLPVMPRRGRLETTGFATSGSRATYWTWPIWSGPIGVDVVKSLLADRRLQGRAMNFRELERAGIPAVFRSQRLTVGKYRNFTMGVPA